MNDILIADSFQLRHVDGVSKVVDLRSHLYRFKQSVLSVLGHTFAENPVYDLERFLSSVPSLLAKAQKDSFPRIQAVVSPERIKFDVLFRALPEIRDTHPVVGTLLSNTEFLDLKGPNIERYASFTKASGGELLLFAEEGHILETTTSSIVWWVDDELRYVADRKNRVESITEKTVLDIAERLHVKAAPGTVSVADLAGLPVWSLNALHGIRPVPSIEKYVLPTNKKEEHLKAFREAYNSLFAKF